MSLAQSIAALISRPSRLRWRSTTLLVLACIALGGCGDEKKSTTQPVVGARYPSLGSREVPAYFKDTILQRANIEDVQPFLVSGYGIVAGLRGTGDSSNLPNAVREYMLKEIARHGYGSHRVQGFENVAPEQVLRDPHYAVVRVDGFIPPGARLDDHFDVQVSALEQSYTTSLSHGNLYSTDLRYLGAEASRPGGSVNTYARAAGAVFVNPAYALNRAPTDPAGRQSLRYGVVMDGGIVDFDNAIVVRVRDPQMSTSRLIERRINERFQAVADKPGKVFNIIVASAQDEAIVHLYLPKAFGGDYEHFVSVIKHLYLNGEPAFLANRARELAEEAVKPDAPLLNISYAWEGIGPAALATIRPLYGSDKPEVAFAAARAGAFIVDETGEAERHLLKMADTKDHPFRINAVQVLGRMQRSPEVKSALRRLVNYDNNIVRIEAYKALARDKDALIFSRVVREKFVLDMLPSSGTPMVYATRRGIPRIVIFGVATAVDTPVTFATLDSRLTVSSDAPNSPVTLFYRGDATGPDAIAKPTVQTSRPEIAEVIARLGGEGLEGEKRFDFSYSDVIAILRAMNEAGKLHATGAAGSRSPVLFILEDGLEIQDNILSAPQIPDPSRPQSTSGREGLDAPQIPDALAPAGAAPAPKAPAGGRAQ